MVPVHGNQPLKIGLQKAQMKLEGLVEADCSPQARPDVFYFALATAWPVEPVHCKVALGSVGAGCVPGALGRSMTAKV